MKERITDFNVLCCLTCVSHGPNSRLHFFLSLSLIYLFAQQAFPAPTSLCRHRHVQQNKRRPAFGVSLFIHDALQSACPFQVLFQCFCLGSSFFFQLLLQHWLAQTDFHIKNRGGNAYVWGAGICNCLLAYVKNKAFSVFLFYFQFVTRIWDRCWNSAKSLWKTDWSLFFFLTRTRFHILLSAYNWDIYILMVFGSFASIFFGIYF